MLRKPLRRKKPAHFDVIRAIPSIVISLAIAVLTVALIAQMLGETDDDMTGDPELAAVQNGTASMAKFSARFGTIATVSVLVIIIALLGMLYTNVRR